MQAGGFVSQVLQRSVAIRTWLFRLPYGDQALFVRAPVLRYPIINIIVLIPALSLLPYQISNSGHTLKSNWPYYKKRSVVAGSWEAS